MSNLSQAALGKATRAQQAANSDVNWTEIVGKPTTYPPNSHTHTPQQITGGYSGSIQVVIQTTPEVKQTLTFTNGILTGV
jgi:hypothetical protein